MTRPLIIGLTGGIASGKSTVADYLATHGAYLIDTDIIAREVVTPYAPTTLAIRELLGADYLLADGQLNRAKIKTRIFSDDDIKKQYESIILPAIRQATLLELEKVPDNTCYTLLIVPLLFEKGLDRHCDYTISVDIPLNEQINRGIERNHNDEAIIRQIITAQMPRAIRNAHSDFIVDNTLSLNNLHEQLNKLHQHLLNLPATA